jgi:serine protease SohB
MNNAPFLSDFSHWFQGFQLLLGLAGVGLLAGCFLLLIVLILRKGRQKPKDVKLVVSLLNEKYDEHKEALLEKVLSKSELKELEKSEKEKAKAKEKEEKERKKTKEEPPKRPRVFVIDFDGDIQASQVESLREQVSAVLAVAKPVDEVVVRLESPGGVVHSYGLAASQLERLKKQNIPLTVCVDRVAASGGYMMACIAHKILSAPFAVIGSIGVVASMPNFNRALKKHDIDFLELTAGEHKRTLTPLGEITEAKKTKFLEQLEDIHGLFKDFVAHHRPNLDIARVASGEHWFGIRARELGLVDEILTSDDYLCAKYETSDVYLIGAKRKESLVAKLQHLALKTLTLLLQR